MNTNTSVVRSFSSAAIMGAAKISAFANAHYCTMVAQGEKPGTESFGFARTQREYRFAIAEQDISILAARGCDETTPERILAEEVLECLALRR